MDPAGDTDEPRIESAAAGLVSFVVRTGVAISLEHVGQDPRYDREADNDSGPVAVKKVSKAAWQCARCEGPCTANR